jgi:hypothetical protein
MKTIQKLDAFEYQWVPHGDEGRRTRGVIVRCPCGRSEPLPVNPQQGYTANDGDAEFRFITKKMEGRGWRIGVRRRDHRCPKCAAMKAAPPNFANAPHATFSKALNSHPSTKVLANMTQQHLPPPKLAADNTREMTREDRRIIFEKLQDSYLDDTVGYTKDWSDEKVALDLNVPRAWVVTLRKENFGDNAGNEMANANHVDVALFNERWQKLQPDIAALLALVKIEPELRALRLLGEKIAKNQNEIMRTLK